MFRRVVEASGRPMVFTCNQRHDGRGTFWKDLMTYAREARDDGHILRPVVAPRPIGVMLGLNGSQNPFSGTPTYRSIEHLPLDQRVEAMSNQIYGLKFCQKTQSNKVHFRSYIESCLHKCFDLVLQLIIHLCLKNRFQPWPKT